MQAEQAGASALRQRLHARGPKAILSLDGGGTRGIISLAFLERMEAVLCGPGGPGGARRLSDHFDLIGGTSTGAIIASALALGWRVAEVKRLYDAFATTVFRRRWYRLSPLVNRYDADALEALLASHFGPTAHQAELLLGSPALRTGLAIVTKRVDTGMPWVVSNLPGSPYYADRGGPNGNWRIPLRHLIRASSAAPTFFRAVSLPLGPRADGSAEMGRFVDGGVTPYNNPAMRLFELARLRCFGLQWPPGKDRMLIVSVGTGRFRHREAQPPPGRAAFWTRSLGDRLLLVQAIRVLQGLIGDGSAHALRSLQGFGYTPAPFPVDSEVGDMAQELFGAEPLFTAIRYDIDLDAMPPVSGARSARALQRMDAPERMQALWAYAQDVARGVVNGAHLRLPAWEVEQDAGGCRP